MNVMSQTPIAAAKPVPLKFEVGARTLMLGPPGTPLHGPALPPGHRVVLRICTGPAALNASSGTVVGSTDTLALAAAALVANSR